MMTDAMPKVGPGQWIHVGPMHLGRPAVVCNVHDNHIEVVYLDDKNKAINEDVIWRNEEWTFKHDGPCGGYADGNSRLARYVSILRRGNR